MEAFAKRRGIKHLYSERLGGSDDDDEVASEPVPEPATSAQSEAESDDEAANEPVLSQLST